jgi:hypothetical protein
VEVHAGLVELDLLDHGRSARELLLGLLLALFVLVEHLGLDRRLHVLLLELFLGFVVLVGLVGIELVVTENGVVFAFVLLVFGSADDQLLSMSAGGEACDVDAHRRRAYQVLVTCCLWPAAATYPILLVEGTLAQLDAMLLDCLGAQLLIHGQWVSLQALLDDLGLLFALFLGGRQLRAFAPIDDGLDHRWAACRWGARDGRGRWCRMGQRNESGHRRQGERRA